MDEDDKVAQFVGITDAPTGKARQYLKLSDNDVQQAIELYFNTGGIDLAEATTASGAASANAPSSSPSHPQPTRRREQASSDIIDLESDEENPTTRTRQAPDHDDDVEMLQGSSGRGTSHQPASHDADAEMARRLQEEMYAGAEMHGGVDAEGYRAPIAPTRETLVGPDLYDLTSPDDVRAATLEQMRQRQRRARNGAPGIFNQQAPSASSIWNDTGVGPSGESAARSSSSSSHADALARATGGASRASSKTTMLAEMYRPPFDIMSRATWEEAREQGKDEQKWLLVNIQDPSIFDCQLLNRDAWKHEGIKDTIRENFIFIQHSKDDPRAGPYLRFYFQDVDNQDAYPHISIVDPRTGEQVKKWSGRPSPQADELHMQLHEFLERYSLNASAKNPVARRKPEPRPERQVASMTEEQQLEMAMQASLATTGQQQEERKEHQQEPQPSASAEDDPDALTRSIPDMRKQQQQAQSAGADAEPEDPARAAFRAISSTNRHIEGPPEKSNTRIQFRHPAHGRVVRRFELDDKVRRLYEWLKAEPLPGAPPGAEFELISQGKNLIELLDETVVGAGLRNGTVNIEYLS